MTHCLNSQSQIEDVDIANDRGFLVGDGVFETLRVEQGKILWFEDHLKRLFLHSEKIQLPLSWQSDCIYQFLNTRIPDKDLYRLRLTVTAGEGGRGYVRPLQPSPRMFASFTKATISNRLDCLRICPHFVPEYMSSKTLSCLDRILHAPPFGEEWVMHRKEGYLTEATMANIFWVRNAVLETPQLNNALLAGLTRTRVLNLTADLGIECHEGNYDKQLLFDASEIFLTGTVSGIVRVEKLENQILSERSITDRIQQGYQQLIEKELTLP